MSPHFLVCKQRSALGIVPVEVTPGLDCGMCYHKHLTESWSSVIAGRKGTSREATEECKGDGENPAWSFTVWSEPLSVLPLGFSPGQVSGQGQIPHPWVGIKGYL